ncbi:MAG: glutathione S-transferase family protein, partial [Alphaproteobacteria bacterium]
YLEKSLGDNEWITGETFSVADIAIATHFISLEIANVKLDASQWPKLAKYIERALARPSFQKVYQPASAAVS